MTRKPKGKRRVWRGWAVVTTSGSFYRAYFLKDEAQETADLLNLGPVNLGWKAEPVAIVEVREVKTKSESGRS